MHPVIGRKKRSNGHRGSATDAAANTLPRGRSAHAPAACDGMGAGTAASRRVAGLQTFERSSQACIRPRCDRRSPR